MIGWKPKPFIFIHIPKCAGTSIEQAFLPVATQRTTFRELTAEDRHRYWLPGAEALQHRKLRAYILNFQTNKYFKFSFVRNPWDRAVSQINYLASAARARVFQGKTFTDQVRIYCNTKAMLWGHDLGANQVNYLAGTSGMVEMDYIGRFESLPADFNIVCEKIGIQPAPPLSHIFNSQRKLHYSAYYDAESAELIGRRFAKDIDFFGYRFERMAVPLSAPVTGALESAPAMDSPDASVTGWGG
jgi:hypothetical protein